ncbi:hypothetical protein MLD38_031539 [Melastoma candidum]|uniref:Uncharacterized protein n=1 Tax=Melastoma candidum TaxID=119954 RepID=A0ACB9MR92_9MYRT|nr:hypothetical protein MLD38_031539 [Melastoma candidum]
MYASLATAAVWRLPIGIRCSSDSDPRRPSRRGFGAKDSAPSPPRRKTSPNKSGPVPEPTQAPGIRPQSETSYSRVADLDFEERLKTIKRSAIEQKNAEEKKQFGAIDYDSPVVKEDKTIGLGTKIGVGLAVVVFGLVFAFGDFLPSGSVNPSEQTDAPSRKLSEEQRATLQRRLKQFEATLSSSPNDPEALEGAAVTLAELGESAKAASCLEVLLKIKPDDPEVYRLLAEVKFELRDFERSVTAYKNSMTASKSTKFEVLRGLTNALIAAKKPDEAVQVLLSSRQMLNSGDAGTNPSESTDSMDPIQVDLLLGKAYSEWRHVSDAVSVYDGIIASHPNDFRGYLAKGIILKENGRRGEAERMFIQAWFFAPEKAKAFVDRYSR